MNGALPPNSSDSFSTVPHTAPSAILPTSGEPAKISFAHGRVRGHLTADLLCRHGAKNIQAFPSPRVRLL
jgi:hypothetical protein